MAKASGTGASTGASVAAPHVAASAAAPHPVHAAHAMQRLMAPLHHEIQEIGSLADRITFKGVQQAVGLAKYAKDAASFTKKVADIGSYTRKAQDAEHAAEAAAKHMYATAQMGGDIQRLRRSLIEAEHGAKYFKSEAAASATVFMRHELQAAESAFHHERSMWHGYRLIIKDHASSLHYNKETALGKIALGAEKFLEKSFIGRNLLHHGKILQNPSVGNAVRGVGAASAALKGYEDSVLHSRAGKLASAAVGGAMSWGTDAMFAKLVKERGMHPAVGLYDAAVKYGFAAAGHKELGEKLTFGKWAEGTAHVLTAIGGAVWTGDSRALSEVHARSMAGKNGAVLQGFAMIGEAISNNGLVDKALTKAADWTYARSHPVAPDVVKSATWWSAH